MSDEFDESVQADPSDRYMVLAASDLSEQALRGLIEEFASRDGTDYGRTEKTLEEKVAIVTRQIEKGDVCIVFDRDEERANLVLARNLDEAP